METMIKGYQWKSNMAYSDVYMFPDNMDKVEIHMPPNTTLIPPPEVPADCEAAWDGSNWYVRLIVPEFPPSIIPVLENPLPVTPVE